jgi:cytochrome c oxidase subunit II
MSLKGAAAILVVLIAAALFGFIAFRSSEKPTAGATATPSGSSSATSAVVDPVAQGKTLFLQFRCNVCHSIDGSRAAGPTMKGLAGSQVKLNTGQVVTANAAYLRQSITDPDTQIVSGYGPDVMSAALDPFTSQINQTENVNALVAYIESLK